jgi:RNA polymerase sigma-70 factor, ECF subfamily
VAEETLVAVSAPSAALELDDVRRGMMELSVLQRDALTLVAVVGLSYREAATICGCAEGTVKSRVSRARKGLLVILARGVFTAEKRHPGRAMNAIVSEGRRLQSAAA